MLTPKTNEAVATTRTTWFTGVVLYVLTIINEVVLPDEVALPTWVAPLVVTAIIGFLYRGSLLLAKYKWWGAFLFLINRAPGYSDEPPADPAAEPKPAPDAGHVDFQTVLVMTAVSVIVTLGFLIALDLI